jgi:hypothetical protein
MVGYTLQEYWDMLDKHDWYYPFSDDRHVYDKGEKEYKKLISIANGGGEEYLQMYNSFQEHHYSGDPWKTTKLPKPERPENE